MLISVYNIITLQKRGHTMGGSISDNNTRVLITMPKNLKELAMIVAKLENRSLSNLIVSTLTNYIIEQIPTSHISNQALDELGLDINTLFSNSDVIDIKNWEKILKANKMFKAYEQNSNIAFKQLLNNNGDTSK